MIEKIMKAVKSGNKKRGRNITIGAVVGMLLSCTVVMGEDNYLWIKNDSEIEFSKDSADKDGTDGTWGGNPYTGDNSWEENTYVNNITLSGKNNGKDSNGSDISYGLRLSGDLKQIEFINNGSINNRGSFYTSGYGIYNENGSIGALTNSGIMYVSYLIYNFGNDSGTSSIESITNSGWLFGGSDGICNRADSGTSSITSIINSGNIYGSTNGILNFSKNSGTSSITSIINSGSINSGVYSISNEISNSGTSSIGNITNSGNIGVSSSGSGIVTSSNTSIGNITNSGNIRGITLWKDSSIGNITNSGVILKIENNEGTIEEIDNYGLIVGKETDAIRGDGVDSITNNGLIFKFDKDKYTAKDESDFGKFGTTTADVEVTVGYDESSKPIIEKYTIINAKAKNKDKDDMQGTESLTLEEGKLSYKDCDGAAKEENIDSTKKYILNGIADTLLVKAGENKLDNSIINAYGTAVKFDNDGGNLTLTGTVVNGGADKTSNSISGNNGVDNLTLEKGTIINGKINMGAGTDTLTIKNGAIINGTIDGGDATYKDTLNFGKASNLNIIAASSDEAIRVLHDISNFENININSNVTFYERTNANDGKEKYLEITGAEAINIDKNGVLTLRIDITKMGSSGDNGKIVGHALYGNTGTITSNGGKLVLALNGAGNESIISFGKTTLGAGIDSSTLGTTSELHNVEKVDGANDLEVKIVVKSDLPDYLEYKNLNKIYHSIISVDDLIENFYVNDRELGLFLAYLNDIYAGNPYSYSSELSRKSTGMFRDIVTENIFRPETNKWMIYGGLTHIDGGTKDTYYGKGYYTYDIGSSDMDADTKITGAYMLGEYGVSDTLTSGIVIGGNKLKSDLSNGSKVDGSAMYLGAYAKKYIGNLKVTAGAGFQYGDYDADRMAVNKVASSTAKPMMKYSDDYNDITYDIYLNGRYSNPMGDNFFLEPYGTLSYTYVDQDGADEGNKTLAIETDSKSFDYTVGKVGLDLKKVIPHEKGKSTLTAGVSYTKIFDGADEENITGRFKGGSDFDILVAHKNEHSIGLNAKYALELESGVLLDVKGTYSVERDSHNGSAKNKNKGEWIVGAGLGYKF